MSADLVNAVASQWYWLVTIHSLLKTPEFLSSADSEFYMFLSLQQML